MQRTTKHLTLSISDGDFSAIRNRAWILTRSLRKVNPFALKTEDVSLSDIAWSLEKLVRYTGHGRFFYSVAEHSVLLSLAMARLAVILGWDEEESIVRQRKALFHDANESYFNDITAPVGMQPDCELLKQAKAEADEVIYDHFGLPAGSDALIKKFDRIICEFEAPQLYDAIPDEWEFSATAQELSVFDGLKLQGWLPNGEGAGNFLRRAEELGITV